MLGKLKRLGSWFFGSDSAHCEEEGASGERPAKRARLSEATPPHPPGSNSSAAADGASTAPAPYAPSLTSSTGLLGSPGAPFVEAKALENLHSLSLFVQAALQLDPVKRAVLSGKITKEQVLALGSMKGGNDSNRASQPRRFGGVEHSGSGLQPVPSPTSALGAGLLGVQGVGPSRRLTMESGSILKGSALDGVCGLPAWSSPAGARGGLGVARSPAPLFSPPDAGAGGAVTAAGTSVLSPYAPLRTGARGLTSPAGAGIPRPSLLSPVIAEDVKAKAAAAAAAADASGSDAGAVPIEPALSGLQALRVAAKAAEVTRVAAAAVAPPLTHAEAAAGGASGPEALLVANALLTLNAAVDHGIVLDPRTGGAGVDQPAPLPPHAAAASMDAVIAGIDKLLKEPPLRAPVISVPVAVPSAEEEGVLVLEDEEEEGGVVEEAQVQEEEEEEDTSSLSPAARRLLVPGFPAASARRLSQFMSTRGPRDFGGSAEGDKVVGRVGTDTVSLQRFQALYDEEWLNDELINFKIMYLQRLADAALADWKAPSGGQGGSSARPSLSANGASLPRGARPPSCLMWNSFFLAKLMEGPEQYTYDNVRRWSVRRKVNWSTLEWVIVPVHLTAHWALAVVDIPGHAVHYYDSMVNDAATGSFPVPAGSGGKLGGRSAGNYRPFLEALTRWVADDSANKLGADRRIATDDGSWTVHVYSSRSGVPQQGNGSDCGMFLLCAAESVARATPFNYSQRTIPLRRRMLGIEILDSQQ